ncbi:MAG TPA: protealysin inhibitor emfourin [Acidobacteriota bacterium]|nr:protealysin inhibitor emfourin [Acidobacteriota bacterium]
MLIKYRRTGGVANIPLIVEVDSAKLPSAESSELEQLVENCGVLSGPDPAIPGPSVPDDFHNKLEIEHENRWIRIDRTDAESSRELLALYDWLRQHRSE